MNSIIAEDWIAHHARYTPSREATYDLASERRYSYEKFDRRIDRAALYLQNTLDIQNGDRVAILSHNDVDVFEIQFACRRIGAIFLPLNWRLAVPELEFICNDATPKALISGVEFNAEAAEVQRLADIEHLVSLNNGGDSDYEAGLAAASGELDTPIKTLDDVWTVMYTSGTTGRPKGAMITYSMAVFNSLQCTMAMDIVSSSKNLVFLPTFHTAGLNVYANPAFHTGATNVIMRAFDPAYFLELLADKELHLTHGLGVPTNFLMLAQEPGFADADLSHLVVLSVGGAAAPLSLIEDFGAKGIKLQQGWGMTETGPLGLFLSGDKALSKVGSSGLPPMYVRLKICDDEGKPVPQGETGELMIKGPTVLPGYWNRDEVNKTIFDDEGYFHTGDACRQDEDGYYYIVDRRKDMFISGGENVYPVEVENVIFQMDGVLENAVVGVPDEKWGKVGRAYVVLKPGANLDGDAIKDYCSGQLARYKVPQQVRFMDELPHNATGKVLKHELPQD